MKESELDRFERADKMKKSATAQQRKKLSEGNSSGKNAKIKARQTEDKGKDWKKLYESTEDFEHEYDYS